MFSKRARAAGVVASLAILLGACKQDVHFTKAPPAGVTETVARPSEPSSVMIGVAIDTMAARAAITQAIGERFRIVEWVTNAACGRRNRAIECESARTDVEFTRKGDVRVEVEGGRILLRVPFHYTFTARGIYWAGDIRDSRSGEVTATLTLEAALAPGFAIELKARDDIAWSARHIEVMKGKLQLASHLDQRLRKAARASAEALKASVTAAALRESVERGWQALAEPIAFMRQPATWLRLKSERVAGAGFAMDGDALVYRVAIGGRVAMFDGQRPAPLMPTRMPEPARQPAKVESQFVVPVTVSMEPLAKAVAAAFKPGEILETLPGGNNPRAKVRVTGASLYPSRENLVVELMLEVIEPTAMAGRLGRAHIVARPVLDGETGVLRLQGLAFPHEQLPEKRTTRAPVRPASPSVLPKSTASTLQLGLEPFAGRIAEAARMDLGGLLASMRTVGSGAVEADIGHGMTLAGRFDKVSVGTIELIRDGLRINFELAGALQIKVGESGGMPAGLVSGSVAAPAGPLTSAAPATAARAHALVPAAN